MNKGPTSRYSGTLSEINQPHRAVFNSLSSLPFNTEDGRSNEQPAYSSGKYHQSVNLFQKKEEVGASICQISRLSNDVQMRIPKRLVHQDYTSLRSVQLGNVARTIDSKFYLRPWMEIDLIHLQPQS